MSQMKKEHERYSYADYLTWPDDERWEIIDGVPYAMSPAPGSRHQEVSVELTTQFHSFLKGKPCKVYIAPFDVRLEQYGATKDDLVPTVVQPDLAIICDKTKIDERGCNGAPDIVIEIASPSTGSYDLTTKFDLYQKHAVKEYWIVHPEEQTVMVFKLQSDGRYGQPDRYGQTGLVPVTLLGDLLIDLQEVFAQ